MLAPVAVGDLVTAESFYERLFGRPADRRPMPGLLEWQLTEGGGVQLVESPDAAGTALLTLAAADLGPLVTELRSRGVDVADPTTGTGARFTSTSDPDGNTITLAEARRD